MKFNIKKRVVFLLIGSAIAWLIGMIASFYWNLSEILVFSPLISITFLTLIVFSISFLFFGYPAPFVMFFTGIFQGTMIKASTEFSVVMALMIATVFMAAYASIRLGDALLDDLIGAGNFKSASKVSFVIIAMALLIAFSSEYLIVA